MAEQQSGWELKWELLVADTWDDPALKQRLLDDPAAVLKERGIEVPANIQVRIVENSERCQHLVLPAKPEASELSEEELESVAGGHFSGLVIGCGGGGGFGGGCRGGGGFGGGFGGGCRGGGGFGGGFGGFGGGFGGGCRGGGGFGGGFGGGCRGGGGFGGGCGGCRP